MRFAGLGKSGGIMESGGTAGKGRNIAIVGSGIAGLSAAWLLSGAHDVTVFEADGRTGGHSNTVDAGGTPVDTGFIVYNEATYPNLTALFAHLKVATVATEMSFAVSARGGRLEYSGSDLGGLFAQRSNLLRPRFWSMVRDLLRFYREAPQDLATLGDETLGAYLDRKRYGAAFRDDHLYPMAAAIWSTPVTAIGDYPVASFIRFCENHGLLKINDRPLWRTVIGGSRRYVERLTAGFADRIETGVAVVRVQRLADAVELHLADGNVRRFDDVVLACHADDALRLLGDADAAETAILGAFGYRRNEAVLHSDPRLMPVRRRVWSAWNYLSEGGTDSRLSVTYWMNPLQHLPADKPLFVTLNPLQPPDPALVIRREIYSHPVFDAAAGAAQPLLWSLQGRRRTWFCGAYFGAGFHEDGLQAGLAVAEQLGGVRRPWTVADPSGRIHVGAPPPAQIARVAA
jgi:predicted NAD/FAD-binding protein